MHCLQWGIIESWQGAGILHLLNVNLASWHRTSPALSNLHHYTRELTEPVALPSANTTVLILLKIWNRIGVTKFVNMFKCSSWTFFWELCLPKQDLFFSQGLKVYCRILFLHPGVSSPKNANHHSSKVNTRVKHSPASYSGHRHKVKGLSLGFCLLGGLL